jgi:phosphonate transport system substrate-binding protein
MAGLARNPAARRLAVLLAAVWVAGCGSAPVSSGGHPAKLRFAFNASADDIQATVKRTKLMSAYLSKAIGIPVELREANSYGAVIEAMRSKKVDVATMGPLSYLLAADRGGAEAIAVPGRISTGPGTYQSCIIVRSDSPIQSVEQLVKGAGGYTFSFVDPASTSGHLLPRAYFDSIGFDPDKGFRKTHYSGSHPTALFTVLGGKVDAAATMPSMLKLLEERGKVKAGEIRILWQSPEIPQSPIVVRKDLPEALKKDIQRAFVEVGVKAPELARDMQATTSHPDFSYYPATDATYNGLREIARKVNNLKLID